MKQNWLFYHNRLGLMSLTLAFEHTLQPQNQALLNI